MTEPSSQDLLKVEQDQTMARIAALTAELDDIVAATADANVDDEHDPEGSTIAFERARVSTLLSQGRAYLEELELAQGRVEDGAYGVCERCGSAIPPERLRARPVARTCIRCPPP
jgi:RNA polymerase-binding transcription factor DksA